MTRLLAIAWKELLQLRRDRLTLAMMAALPVVQLLLFGYAINTDVRHIPTFIYDRDRSPLSRDFAARMRATGFIVRGITLKGSGFGDVAGELVWLTAVLSVLVVVASLRFRKKLT